MTVADRKGRAETRSDELAGLLLPVHGGSLLLPHEAIAEVISHAEPNPIPGGPPWLLGTIAWRGLSLPLVSYERLNGRAVPGEAGTMRVSVINGVGGDPRLPFFGLATRAIPRPTRLMRDDLAMRDGKKGPADVQLVTVREVEAVIPNLMLIEKMLLRQLHSAGAEA